MSDREWDSIRVESIYQTQSDESNIIFLKCLSTDDVAKITSRAHNLPKSTNHESPRIVMHVDKRARARHAAFQTIAQTIRQQSDNRLQTSVRIGKKDFLLRKKIRGEDTPWSQIPPVKIAQNIPAFEIGLFKDIFENSEDEEDEDDDDEDDEENEDDVMDQSEEMKRLMRDFAQQEEERETEEETEDRDYTEETEEKEKNINKRNRSQESTSNEQSLLAGQNKFLKQNQKNRVQFNESENETEEENIKNKKKYMNSTMIETRETRENMNMNRNIVLETPAVKGKPKIFQTKENKVLETPEQTNTRKTKAPEDIQYE